MLRAPSPETHYPRLIEDNVYSCGFTSPKSYGANSYLILDPAGNWLADSPRFTPAVVDRIAAWGGLRWIFLTHRDDVADAARYKERFGAHLIIHEADAEASPDAEVLLWTKPYSPAPGFLIIPVPGHTRGHCALLYKDKFLFSGDHVAGDPDGGELDAFRNYCWYDWNAQIRSMESLIAYRFEWVLPGHGRRLKLEPSSMRGALGRLIERMKATA
jgi:glyoxylase-like metal-dependent hydrolase (beta-lactamase superfamily II)